MSVVAEFSIRADQFLLGEMIAEFPGLSVDIERVVPAGRRIMPYIWAHGGDREEFVAAMNENRNVESIVVLDRLEDSSLYKIAWEDPAEHLVYGIYETGATILEAHSEGERWEFRVRFESHDGLAKFNDYCNEHGIAYQLNRVSHLTETSQPVDAYGLTEPQREALSLAVERGYFQVPRQVTFDELADELGVSVQALSERVRRGADKVLRTALSQQSDENA